MNFFFHAVYDFARSVNNMFFAVSDYFWGKVKVFLPKIQHTNYY